jgi:hypothetical protein
MTKRHAFMLCASAILTFAACRAAHVNVQQDAGAPAHSASPTQRKDHAPPPWWHTGVPSSAQPKFAYARPDGGTIRAAGNTAYPVGPAGGKLSGTYPNPGVNLSPSDLPSFSIAGDVVGSNDGGTVDATVVAISGPTPILITPRELEWLSGTTKPFITQQPTDGGTPTPMAIVPQASTAAVANGGQLHFDIPPPNGGDPVGGIFAQELAIDGGTTVAYMELAPPDEFTSNIPPIAQSGMIRMPPGLVMAARNPGNSADLQVLYVDPGTGLIALGANATAGTIVAGETMGIGGIGGATEFIDPTGPTTYATLTAIDGASGLDWTNGVTSLTYSIDAAANAAAPINTLISGQSPGGSCSSSANCTPGSVEVSIGSPGATGSPSDGTFFVSDAGHTSFVADNQGVLLGRSDSSQQTWRFAPLVGGETAYAGAWTGSAALAPTSGNYTFAVGGGTFFIEANTIQFGATQITATSFYPEYPGLGSAYIIGAGSAFSDAAPGAVQLTGCAALPAAVTNLTGGKVIITPGAGATSNGTPGNLVINIPAPTGSGTDGFTQFARNGTIEMEVGYQSSVGGEAIWGSVGSPSSTNYLLASDGTNTLLNTPSSSLVKLLVGGTPYLNVGATSVVLGGGSGIGTGGAQLLQVDSAATSAAINQGALASTSAGSGSNGEGFTITAQAGQAATGASHNGGNGGTLSLSGGAGGTSGSATAGTAAGVNLQVGGTTQLSIAGFGIGVSTQTQSITASSTTTVSLTATQYAAPVITLTGTISSAAVVTVALPSSTAMWFFDISGVTFTSGSVKWTCGGGTASATISSLLTASEIVQVLCRTTTVSINE